MPFGFDGVFWRLMDVGIDWMIAVSQWVAALPGAIGRMAAFGTGPLIGDELRASSCSACCARRCAGRRGAHRAARSCGRWRRRSRTFWSPATATTSACGPRTAGCVRCERPRTPSGRGMAGGGCRSARRRPILSLDRWRLLRRVAAAWCRRRTARSSRWHARSRKRSRSDCVARAVP